MNCEEIQEIINLPECMKTRTEASLLNLHGE